MKTNVKKRILILGFFLAATRTVSALFAQTPIAKVDTITIYIEEVQKLLASTPYGTMTKDQLYRHPVMPSVVSDLIDSEILYQESLKRKIPGERRFLEQLENFKKSVLSEEYRQYFLRTNLVVDENAVAAYARSSNIKKEAAKAVLVAEKKRRLMEKEEQRVFDYYGVKLTVAIAQTEPGSLKAEDELVKARDFSIVFGNIKDGFSRYGSSKKDLLTYVEQEAVSECFMREAIRTGLHKSISYKDKLDEYSRSLSINELKAKVENALSPADKEVSEYIENFPHVKFEPREATVLMIVVADKDEAEKVYKKAQKGENFHQLAIDYSIAPNAKVNAGRIPVLKIGENPYNEVDRVILDMDEGEVSKPVKGSRGYSIFKLLGISKEIKRQKAEIKEVAKSDLISIRFRGFLDKLRESHKIILYGPDGKSFGINEK